MEVYEAARESVRDLFEAQVANFRVLDLLQMHEVVVSDVAEDIRRQLAPLGLDPSDEQRVARQLAQTFVRPEASVGPSDINDVADRIDAKAAELAALAKNNLGERDLTGLTIRRDLYARSRESMLVTLWSDFEAFVAELLGVLARRVPDPLVPETRQVTLADVLQYGTLDELISHLAQSKIDAILRGPFESWIGELCGAYSLTAPDISDSLKESYLRRNIVVHAGATVNSVYLDSIAKLDVDTPAIGSRLSVDREYLENIADELATLAFSLAIAAVAKHDKGNLGEAESEFVNLCYILLIEGRPGAVALIGERFRTERFTSRSSTEIVRVNFWLACRDLGILDKHLDEIRAWDTSALEETYEVAKIILLGDLDEALSRVNAMRESGRLQERFWKTWPLFRDLRARDRAANSTGAVDTTTGATDNLDSQGDL